MRKRYARLGITNKSYLRLLNISKVNAFSLNMRVVYTYIRVLNGSVSEVYMYVLFDVAYGLDGPGIESGGGRFSAPVQTGREAHTDSCIMGTVSFSVVRCGRSVMLTPHPVLVPRSKIEYSYKSTLSKGLYGL